ncbi:MAG: hypothetical protein ACE148_16215 [Vicinamibacterales bacterium]
MIEGAVPFRDFFEVMGPLSFYWPALWFKVLGTSWFTARSLLLTVGALTASLLYWSTARVYGRRAATVAALLCTILGVPLWTANNHHWDSNLFFMIALAATTSWSFRQRAGTIVLAGVAAGITAGFMLQKGILALAAILLVVLLQTRPNQWNWRTAIVRATPPLMGFSAVAAVAVAGFLAAGALGDLYYANVVWPLTRYRTLNTVPYAYKLREFFLQSWFAACDNLPMGLSHIVPCALALPLVAVAVLPLVGLLATIRQRLSRGRFIEPSSAPLWLLGIALWLAETHRLDMSHLLYGSPILAAAVAGALLSAAGTLLFAMLRRLLALVVASACLLGLWSLAVASAASIKMDTRRGEVRMHRRDTALAFLHSDTRAGDSLFVYPYYPMYYFLADVRNPTRYSILMYGINTSHQFRDAVLSIERQSPQYVLWDTLVDGPSLTRWFPAYVHPPQNDQLIENYLAARYSEIRLENGFRVLRRKPHPLDSPRPVSRW